MFKHVQRFSCIQHPLLQKHFTDLNRSYGVRDGSEDAQDERALRAEDALLQTLGELSGGGCSMQRW